MSYIIMKYDDLSQDTLADFSRVAEFSIYNNFPVSMGLIGLSLISDNIDYQDICRKWMNNNIELWNHGFFHTDEEFFTSSFEEQCKSIAETQRFMKEKIGKAATTFGSPHNNSTETTIQALNKVASEINNYLFAVDGTSSTKARQLLVRCNMETVTGNIDFNFFKKNYEILKDLPYMVIQGHPSFWKEKDFKLNEEIMDYLKKEGNIFITPSELPDIHIEADLMRKIDDELKSFIDYIKNCDKKVALYGSGQIGRELFRFLKTKKNINVDKFVVSDGQSINEKLICDRTVLCYSEFVSIARDYIVIPALMPKFHAQIKTLMDRDGIQYYGNLGELEYLRLINLIRLLDF